jgi:hypothetical protein
MMPERHRNDRASAFPAPSIGRQSRRHFTGGAPPDLASPEAAMLSDRTFLRLALTSAGLAIVLSFTLAVAVVGAAEPPRPATAFAAPR